MNSEVNQIDQDWCRSYLAEHIFKLLPPTYRKEYPIWPGMVGIEVEMMPFLETSFATTPAMLPLVGESSLQQYLGELLLENRLWKAMEKDGAMSSISLGDNDQLTFEPGGQLEYSSKPYPCLEDACGRLHLIQGELSSFFAKKGVRFLQAGSHPWQDSDSIGLQMAKPRYRAMNEYFGQIGPFGKRMMRETCTVQVNLDFGASEELMATRYLVANLLAPFLTASFANSPISLGKPNGFKSTRANIWQNLDPSRTGFPKLSGILEAMNRSSCVEAYLDSVLDAGLVFVEGQDFKVPEKAISFRDWMQDGLDGIYPKASDFETHLSLHFPEVRARGFMEIRSIDSQAKAWQLIPACILTGILYDAQCLEQTAELLLPKMADLKELWQASVHGLNDLVLRELSPKIMYLALDGFRRLPSCYQGDGKGKVLQTFISEFTEQGRCPADDILDAYHDAGQSMMQAETLFAVHEKWMTKIS